MPVFAQEWWLMPAVLFLVGCIASHRIALHRIAMAPWLGIDGRGEFFWLQVLTVVICSMEVDLNHDVQFGLGLDLDLRLG